MGREATAVFSMLLALVIFIVMPVVVRQLEKDRPRATDHSGVMISGGWTVGGSSRGGGLVPGGSCSGTGAGSVGGVGCVGGTVGLSMFGSGVSGGVGMLIDAVSGGRWRESCLSGLTHGWGI
jgi:hypothetical protein